MADPSLVVDEQKQIKDQEQRELDQILRLLLNIRRSTGYGQVVIVLRAGEIIGLDETVSHRPKVENKLRE